MCEHCFNLIVKHEHSARVSCVKDNTTQVNGKEGKKGVITMTDRYINAREIAKMLNVSRATVYNWLKRGKLPEGNIIGFARRWSINELQAFWNRDNNHVE